jgi:hypothetical protein
MNFKLPAAIFSATPPLLEPNIPKSTILTLILDGFELSGKSSIFSHNRIF